MIAMRRTLYGYGRTNHTPIAITGGFPGRPCTARTANLVQMDYSMSGPAYKGMDPSDPLTYTRAWNPAPGMIAYLNFDGAQMQGRTPTQLQRGPQTRIRKLRMTG